MRLVNVLASLQCGCAVHAVGYVQANDGSTELLLPDGRAPTLALLDAGAAPMSHLDGWMVEVDGSRRLDSIRVKEWRAIEGPHGIAAWVGPIQSYGGGVGLMDRGSKALYVLDDATAARLRGLPGSLVAAEAYVTGPQTLQVIHYLVIDP